MCYEYIDIKLQLVIEEKNKVFKTNSYVRKFMMLLMKTYKLQQCGLHERQKSMGPFGVLYAMINDVKKMNVWILFILA